MRTMNTARQCQHIQLISCTSQMEAEKALFIASGVAVIATAYNLILEGNGGEQSFTVNELQVTCQNIVHTAARNAFEFVKKPDKKWFVVRQYRGNSFRRSTFFFWSKLANILCVVAALQFYRSTCSIICTGFKVNLLPHFSAL